MKGPTKHDAHSDPHPAGAAHPAPAAVNPHAKGDKVTTKLGGKGKDVEAEVVAVWKDEVQVKTPDGELRWRTIRTVRPAVASITPPGLLDRVEPPVMTRKKRTTKKRV